MQLKKGCQKIVEIRENFEGSRNKQTAYAIVIFSFPTAKLILMFR
jgi:hypothetical protein